MNDKLSSYGIVELKDKLSKKEISSKDIINSYSQNIEDKNDDLGVFLEVFNDVKENAEKSDEKIRNGNNGLLEGIPISIKDNILIEGRECTGASEILYGHKAVYDATVISKLKKEGAILMGRTNMDEFAMGSSTENSAYKVTKNPHDINRVPGGSSGGAAVSVVSEFSAGALGSDTGGSIRQPASFCGCVGMKPTYGTVSRYGLMSLASSFDQIGPLTKNVQDAELIFSIISGRDINDSTSVDYKYKKVIDNKKLKIGVPEDFLTEGIDKDVLQNFNESLKSLENIGHIIKKINLPTLKYSLPVYYIIMPAEASSNLARYDGIRFGKQVSGDTLLSDYTKTRGEGFGPEVRRRIMLGTYVLSSGYYDAYYGKAVLARNLIKNDFQKSFLDVDIIAMPTSPIPAFKIGEKTKDPLSMYLSDIFTVSANVTGLPAISIPSGMCDRDGVMLPISIQFIAPWFSENIMFNIANMFEKIKY